MKTWTDDAKAHVDRYLRQVQVRLEGGGADAHEVVEDLRRHIDEQAQLSANVVITIDEAKRIVAETGTPDEVASSWAGLEKNEAGLRDEDAGATRAGRKKLFIGLGIGAVLVLSLIVYAAARSGVLANEQLREAEKAERAASELRNTFAQAKQEVETLRALPEGWFQAGSNTEAYEAGTVAGPKGFNGDAIIIKSTQVSPSGFATVMRDNEAVSFRGKRITVSGTVATELKPGKAQMWLRIDGPNGEALGFDNMGDRPIVSTTDAKAYSLTMDVPENAENIAFGVLMTGRGMTWFSPIVFAGSEVVAPEVEAKPASMTVHEAAKGGHMETLEGMLNGGADINAVDSYGFTPLHYAAMNGHVETTRMLVGRGADRSIRNGQGKTAEDLAIENGHEETLAGIWLAK